MKKNIRTTTEFLSSLIKNAKHFSEEKKIKIAVKLNS